MARRRTTVDDLLAEACAPDEPSLLEFYQSNLPHLNNIRLKDVRFRVLDDIALRLHGTMLRETDWMAFLNELGIVDNRAIVFIKFKSKWREELPIYLALSGPLNERLTFGDLIKCLIGHKREDALLEIKAFVESLLNKSESHLWVPQIPTAPEVQDCKKEDFQGQCLSIKNTDKDEKGPSKSYNFTSVKKELITILILHTDEDINVAQELSLQLKQPGFSVKTLSDFDHLLMINRFELFPALLFVVDFIVPIVSESFLNQIRSGSLLPMTAPFEEFDNENNFSNDANNRYIYQLAQNEFLLKKCLNIRVRPVAVPKMNRRRLMYDLLLTNSYQLWEKVPDFIVMLKKTKQLFKKLAI